MATNGSPRTKLYVGMHDGALVLTRSESDGVWEKGGVTALAHAAARFAHCASTPQRAYLAAYESGVWRTDDGGQSWRRLDSYPTDYAHSIAVHPHNPDIIFVGSEPAAVFSSQDGGLTWQECTGFRQVPESSQWEFHGGRKAHVRDLRISTQDPDLIYAAIEVGGVVRSRDGGKTWKQLPGTDTDVHSLHICNSQPATVYAATAVGPYRSDDGGDTWQSIQEGLQRGYTVPIISPPDDHRRVLVGVASNAERKGAQAYLSTDAGGTWQRMDLSTEDDMAVVFTWDPLDPNRVYAGTDSGRLFQSADRGETWEPVKVDIETLAVGALVAVAIN